MSRAIHNDSLDLTYLLFQGLNLKKRENKNYPLYRFDTCAWHGPEHQEVIKWKWPKSNKYMTHYAPKTFLQRSHISLKDDQYCRLSISRLEPKDEGIWTCKLHLGVYVEASGKINVSFASTTGTVSHCNGLKYFLKPRFSF